MIKEYAGGGDFQQNLPQQKVSNVKAITIENIIPEQPVVKQNYVAEATVGIIIAVVAAIIIKKLTKK